MDGGRRRATTRGWGGGIVSARAGMGAGFHVFLYESSVRGPIAVGDTGLYYVWRDEGCLTADKPLGESGLPVAPFDSHPNGSSLVWGGVECLEVWKCYTATSRIKPGDFHHRGATGATVQSPRSKGGKAEGECEAKIVVFPGKVAA